MTSIQITIMGMLSILSFIGFLLHGKNEIEESIVDSASLWDNR